MNIALIIYIVCFVVVLFLGVVEDLQTSSLTGFRPFTLGSMTLNVVMGVVGPLVLLTMLYMFIDDVIEKIRYKKERKNVNF